MRLIFAALTAAALFPIAAQAQPTLADRTRADSMFLDRVRTAPAATAPGMMDSVRVRMPQLDSTFDMLVMSGNANSAMQFASTMNSHWQRFGDAGRALSQFQRAIALPGVPSRIRAAASSSAAFIAFRQRDQATARTLYESALRIATQVNDTVGMAAAYTGLGRVAARDGNYAETQRLSEQAVRLVDALGDVRRKYSAYHPLAFALRLQKKYEQAARVYEYTIALLGLTNNPSGVAGEMFNLGFTRLHLQDTVTAGRLLRESLTAMRESNSADQKYVLGAFAALATLGKQPRRAALLWGAMLAELDLAKLTLDPDDQFEIDSFMPLARREMRSGEFEAALTDGRKMSVGEAVNLALSK